MGKGAAPGPHGAHCSQNYSLCSLQSLSPIVISLQQLTTGHKLSVSTASFAMLWCTICCIVRPHHSTTHIDAAYCYRPSSVVCRLVGLGLSVTLVSPTKMAAPIEMPFGLRTQVGPGNHVLDRGPDPPMIRSNLEGKTSVPLKSMGTLYGHVCKND